MAEQDTTETCILPNMPALPSSPEDLSHDIRRYLEYHLGRFLGCDRFYLYESLAYTVRDRIMSDFIRSLKPWLAVPASEALALFRALAAPGVYRELVERAGWDRDRFAAWAADTMGREILRP